MVSTSFRARCRQRVYPGASGGKLLGAGAAAAAAFGLAAAGCSGGKEQSTTRQVSFRGARFATPAAWQLTRTPTTLAAAPGGESDELVSVSVFRLLRAYSPALWERVVPELDRAADELGRQLAASLSGSRTVTVAGGRARVYELAFKRQGRDVRERITFVLRGRREYELLCRWRASEQEPAACATLLSSFSFL